LALAVVLARQRDQRLGKTDEADGQRAVFEHFADLVVGSQLFGIYPHALPHKEGEVLDALFALDLEAVEQLTADEVELALEILEEPIDIALAVDRNARQVDRGEGQVA